VVQRVGLSAALVFIECPARNRNRIEKSEVEINNKKLNSNSSAG
jgi:hypothetical protein